MPFKIVRNDITKVRKQREKKNFSQREQVSVRSKEVTLLLPVHIA